MYSIEEFMFMNSRYSGFLLTMYQSKESLIESYNLATVELE